MRTIVLLLSIFSLSLGAYGFQQRPNQKESQTLKTKSANIKRLTPEGDSKKKGPIATFLTFQDNNAEEAMNFYISLFEDSKVTSIRRHEEGGPAKPGTILMATFELNGSQFACSDSYTKHAWGFTPGVSIFVECKSEEELKNLFTKLSENGKVFMPLGNYGFSKSFGFIEDQFGVSWQLNLN